MGVEGKGREEGKGSVRMGGRKGCQMREDKNVGEAIGEERKGNENERGEGGR